MSKKLAIAIDGPSGAGKSTIAKNLARIMGIEYIDTGAMYRALGYKILQEGIDPEKLESLEEMLEATHIDFSKGDIILDGKIINDEIRKPEIAEVASRTSAIKEIREKLVALQRSMAATKSVVMDGRDIGTNVLAQAPFKFYITASGKERAIRRWKELVEKGENISLEKVEKDIIQRDYNDTNRSLNPLCKAEDAIEIDTTDMTIDDVVNKILEVIQWRR